MHEPPRTGPFYPQQARNLIMEVFYGFKCQKTYLTPERTVSWKMIGFLYILLTEIKYFVFAKDSVIPYNVQPEDVTPHFLLP